MEKRFIIAIFLITLVMIVSNEYLWKKPTPQKTTDKVVQTKELGRQNQQNTLHKKDTIKKQIETPTHLDLQNVIQDSAKTEEFITVDTELYRAKFSTKGAKLISWELKKHLDRRDKNNEKFLLVRWKKHTY